MSSLAKPAPARLVARPASGPVPPPVAAADPRPPVLRGFALLRTIPLRPDEWRRSTGSPFPRRD